MRRRWPRALVIGVDRNDVLEDAQRAHAIDVAADDLGMLADVDLVVLAAPVLANLAVLARLQDVITGDALITDVGSTKSDISAAARSLPPRLTFIGGHPLAGAARAGILAGSPDLFRNRPWILTPDASTPGDVHARLDRFIRALGAEPRVMDAAEHDRIAGWVSHLPQLAASALMRVIGEAAGDEGLSLSGRGLRDTTRLASSPAHIWIDVCQSNRAVIAQALDRYIRELQSLRDGLGTPGTIEETFAEAIRWRERMPD